MSTQPSSSSLLNVWNRGIPLDQLTPKASAQSSTSTEIDPFDQQLNHLHSNSSSSSSSSSSSQTNKPTHHHRRQSSATSSKFSNYLRKQSYTTHPININSSSSSSAINQLNNSLKSSSHPNSSIIHNNNSNNNNNNNDDLKTPMPQSQKNLNYFQPNESSTITTATTSPSIATTALKTFGIQNNRNTSSAFNFTNNPITRSQQQQQKNISPTSTKTPSSDRLSTLSIANSSLSTNPSSKPSSSNTTHSSLHRPTNSQSVTKNTSSPTGLLSVKIISASSLKFACSQSRPYVFAQFDNNEFASREPIGEEEEESKGVVVATKPEGSSAPSTNRENSKSSNPTIHSNNLTQHNSATGNGLYCLSGQNPIWKQEVDFDVTQYQAPFNTQQTLYISIYDRSVGDLHHQSHQSNLPIPGIEGVEKLLGEAEIKLDFENLSKVAGWVDQWYPLTMKTTDPTTPIDSGKIRIQLKYVERKSKKSLDVSDFEFLRMIGKGTFGRVFQVRKKDTRRIYAMKVLSKKEVIDKKEVQHTIGERNILQQSSKCPFLLGLKFSFQSPGELFLVMDYKSGGELFHHLQKEGRFTEERARFYTAEIVLALEHLHKYNIVYRDLKPENILLDATGHIVLCDFGLSKPNLNPDELTTTFCGTTEYLAPEVLLDDHGYSKLVDFWSLGVLLFEMCCGWSPFYAEDNQQMYKNICFGKIKFPRGVIGDDGKQFVKGLLNRNPKHRLGSQNDTEDLKKHEFFKAIDWELLAARQIVPTFKPHIESDESVSNFDKEFTQLKIEEHLPMTIQERLRDGGGGREMGPGGRGLFDENDRSADWVKQASYVTPSGLAAGVHQHHSTKKADNPDQEASPIEPGADSQLDKPASDPKRFGPSASKAPHSPQDSASAAPLAPAAPEFHHPGALPLTKGSEDQDQFLGFSYHGESDLLLHAIHSQPDSAPSSPSGFSP